MIYHDRVISTLPALPYLVSDALTAIPENARLLDVGTGEGRLRSALTAIRPDVEVIGLEYDESLALSTASSPNTQGRLVVGDAGVLPFADATFDVVASVNTLHEVVDAQDPGIRATRLQKAMGGLSRVLKPGGSLIVYDGIMPDASDERLTIYPASDAATELLMRFKDEYLARPFNAEPLDEQCTAFSSDMASVVTFLTKIAYLTKDIYLDGKAWEGERRQLYPFSTLDGLIHAMTNSNVEVESVTHRLTSTSEGHERLLKNYSIKDSQGKFYSLSTFPECQALLIGRKHEPQVSD